MTLGKTQSFARECNIRLVLEALEKKSMSATELSLALHLSNATLSSVLKSLCQMGLIEPVGFDSVSGSGRKRVQYSLSSTYGVLLAVNFSSERYHARLYSLSGEVLLEKEDAVERYDAKTIEKAVIAIQKAAETLPLPIRYAVVCLPGLVSSVSGELQSSVQFDPSLFDPQNQLQKRFSEAFHCPVKLENDTKVMMSGELAKGSFAGADSGLLAYVDYGVGGAFEFGGQCFRGGNGYSGEIGRILLPKEKGGFINLDDAASLRSMKDALTQKGRRPHVKEIVESFHSGNPKTREVVLASAQSLGEGLRFLNSVLDLERIVISGRVAEFGEEYLSEVRKAFGDPIDVVFGSPYEDSLFFGAKRLGLSYLWDNVPKAPALK